MTNPSIHLNDVSFSYNVNTPMEKEVLRNISLSIGEGERVGIMGTPGSGKTTLAMLLAGLIPPSSGCIETPGTGHGKIGLVFQFPERQIFGHTVFEEITFSLREVMALQGEKIETAYAKACSIVDLDAKKVRDRRPSQMSSGEKRRIAIAGILTMEPKVLIFDEPTACLDPRGRKNVCDEINAISKSGNTTIVISHDLEDLIKTSDRLILLEDGRIIHDGKTKEILNKLTEDEKMICTLPYVTELLVRLKKKGLNVRADITDGKEALQEIRRAIRS